jgi:hypothetical protein
MSHINTIKEVQHHMGTRVYLGRRGDERHEVRNAPAHFLATFTAFGILKFKVQAIPCDVSYMSRRQCISGHSFPKWVCSQRLKLAVCQNRSRNTRYRKQGQGRNRLPRRNQSAGLCQSA